MVVFFCVCFVCLFFLFYFIATGYIFVNMFICIYVYYQLAFISNIVMQLAAFICV